MSIIVRSVASTKCEKASKRLPRFTTTAPSLKRLQVLGLVFRLKLVTVFSRLGSVFIIGYKGSQMVSVNIGYVYTDGPSWLTDESIRTKGHKFLLFHV